MIGSDPFWNRFKIFKSNFYEFHKVQTKNEEALMFTGLQYVVAMTTKVLKRTA